MFEVLGWMFIVTWITYGIHIVREYVRQNV